MGREMSMWHVQDRVTSKQQEVIGVRSMLHRLGHVSVVASNPCSDAMPELRIPVEASGVDDKVGLEVSHKQRLAHVHIRLWPWRAHCTSALVPQ